MYIQLFIRVIFKNLFFKGIKVIKKYIYSEEVGSKNDPTSLFYAYIKEEHVYSSKSYLT